ncbi:hypothetical protein FHT00_001029 [Sphingomonas insulae]|uniref:Uncharacterized protein n=1 Tax=Sphingomonas insulae TaxID=424800 RepID=A0ABP3SXW8_9SPHN|nr:hypothetical protein [Sphingomonas insulae]NIJ29096.1 hypothetical protein [Sphingomonas insulae]
MSAPIGYGPAMVWQHLSTVDCLAIAIVVLSLAAIVPLQRRDRRLRQRRAAEWHEQYFHKGGLVRALMRRWRHGPARLTDQRPQPDPGE